MLIPLVSLFANTSGEVAREGAEGGRRVMMEWENTEQLYWSTTSLIKNSFSELKVCLSFLFNFFTCHKTRTRKPFRNVFVDFHLRASSSTNTENNFVARRKNGKFWLPAHTRLESAICEAQASQKVKWNWQIFGATTYERGCVRWCFKSKLRAETGPFRLVSAVWCARKVPGINLPSKHHWYGADVLLYIFLLFCANNKLFRLVFPFIAGNIFPFPLGTSEANTFPSQARWIVMEAEVKWYTKISPAFEAKTSFVLFTELHRTLCKHEEKFN